MVIGCNQPAMEQALVDACIEFCEETRIVNRTTLRFNSVAGTASYTLSMPAGTTTVTLLEAFYNSNRLGLVGPDDFVHPLELFPTVGTETAPAGDPSIAALLDPDTVRVFPIPNKSATNAFLVRVATKPTRAATQVDDILFDNWADAIVNGAAARLHTTPNQPYTSLTDEQRARTLFKREINRASIEASRGRVKRSQMIRMNPLHEGGRRWL